MDRKDYGKDWFGSMVKRFAWVLVLLLSMGGLADLQAQPAEYKMDDNTLFLAHFNEFLDADYAKGEKEAEAKGVTLTKGKFDKGVLIDNNDRLSYKAKGNFNPVKGTIEMWVKLSWDASTEESNHCFFHLQNTGKDEQILWYYGKGHSLYYTHERDNPRNYKCITSRIDWKPDEWHHIAVTWDISKGDGKGEISLFIDGLEKAFNDQASAISKVPEAIVIGSWANFTGQLEGVIDDLRISDIPHSFSEKLIMKEISVSLSRVRVSGIVFNDRNQNNLQDEGEEGLKGIAVSDGSDIVLSDKQGRYKLHTEIYDPPHFVFVTTPTGYRTTSKFYQPVSEDSQANFGLYEAPETKKRDFSFVHITDMHLSRLEHQAQLIEDIKEINSLEKKISFVVCTGDVTEPGTKKALRLYSDAIKEIKVSLYSVFGAHDGLTEYWGKMPKSWTKYHRELLGPVWYSFNWGGRHFIALVSELHFLSGEAKRQQEKWLRKDLSLQPSDKEIVLFWHTPPTRKRMDELSQKNKIIALFYGHWHSNKIFRYNDILIFCTPPLRMGGMDSTPRGFRIVSFKDNKITTHYRPGGQKGEITIISPVGRVTLSKDRISIKANVYDTSMRVKKVEYQVNNSPWKGMKPVGDWTWQSEYKPKIKMRKKENVLVVRATNSQGESWEKSSTFNLSNSLSSIPRPRSDWPMFRGNISHSGVSSDIVRPPLSLAWSQNTGGTLNVSSPVISNGKVFIGVDDQDGMKNVGVIAFDAITGERKWKYITDSAVKHTPAISDNKVYVISVTGTVYCLDAFTGAEKWRHEGNSFTRWEYASPVIYENVVYAGSGRHFAAFDTETGEKLWRRDLGGAWLAYSSLAISEDNLYVASLCYGRGLFALNRKNGSVIWNKKLATISGSAPSISDNVLYIMGRKGLKKGEASGRGVYAFDTKDGRELWSYSTGIAISSPAICEGVLYIGSAVGKLFAIDIHTGKELWYFQTKKAVLTTAPYDRSGSNVCSSPTISGDVVYFGSNDGNLYALNRKTGKKLWNYELGVPIISSPAISGNTLYVGAYDGNLYAFVSQHLEK